MATDVGGNPDLVLHGQTGLLVPTSEPKSLASAIDTLLRDPEKASSMGEAGRDRARRQHDADAIVPLLERLYEHLLQGRQARGRRSKG